MTCAAVTQHNTRHLTVLMVTKEHDVGRRSRLVPSVIGSWRRCYFMREMLLLWTVAHVANDVTAKALHGYIFYPPRLHDSVLGRLKRSECYCRSSDG